MVADLQTHDPVTFTLVDVMESWPLQLSDVGVDGVEHVFDLLEDARITRQGEHVTPSDLRAGQELLLEFSDLDSVLVKRITILDERSD